MNATINENYAQESKADPVEDTPDGDKPLFRNRYTGKEARILKREDIPSDRGTICVYTLSDGNRWESGQFVRDWCGVEQ